MKILCFAILLLATFSLSAAEKTKSQAQIIDMAVTEKGFEPSSIKVKPGSDVTLHITRKTDSTCAKEIQVPSKKLKKELPLNKMVSLEIGKIEKGEINFGCGMNMMVSGVISLQ